MAGTAGWNDILSLHSDFARMIRFNVLLLISCLCCCTGTAQKEADYVNSIGMKFILVKPGEMTVGKFQPTINLSDNPHLPDKERALAEAMAAREAMPGFTVSIKKPFHIGQFEVTQGQWKKVMGKNPSYFQGDKVSGDSDQYPVENVTWQDAQTFIRKLNELEKGKAVYRLPSEFEWEYAARAGATDDISWAEINTVAHIAKPTTQAVGLKQPNAWGMYDMLGNVWEWVDDYYNEKIFADAVPLKKGKEHVLKGSAFYGDVKNATYMTHAGGPGSGYDVGFRIVAEIK